MADIRIHGLRELSRRLRRLPDNMARKGLQKAVNKGADVVKATAEGLAPTGKEGQRGNPPGYLKKQIRRRASNRGLGKFSRGAAVGVVTDKKSSRKKGLVNTDAYYWTFIEFGTSKMSAQPFIRPAQGTTLSLQIEKVKGELREWLSNPANRR